MSSGNDVKQDYWIRFLKFKKDVCLHPLFFPTMNIFYKNIEAKICKRIYKPEVEISKRMIILSDENLKLEICF